ncbi:hypothetical protein pkur_cds_216 [Pandoravirus kuranda]|uniref:Uncharacterized protein n=1 Tax=Pandoravirus kuranda TaxID=3019033 RepID=A0AA95EC82_9VIRU|nr:hypothetical protein pkur_cds_216 [Pandoravirus kuranda]
MNSAYGASAWGGPSMAGGAKMAAIHQCLDALRPPSPPLRRHAAPAAPMAALDALPSPIEPFCPLPPPPPPPLETSPQTAPVAQAETAPTMLAPKLQRAAQETTAASAEASNGPVRAAAAPSMASARATSALRSPAVLAIGAAVVVVLVLVVVAPPFVLKKRGGPGVSGDPACRWARPRAQIDPVRLLAWGMLTAAAAFVLPLAVERLTAAPLDRAPKTGTLFCRKRTQA